MGLQAERLTGLCPCKPAAGGVTCARPPVLTLYPPCPWRTSHSVSPSARPQPSCLQCPGMVGPTTSIPKLPPPLQGSGCPPAALQAAAWQMAPWVLLWCRRDGRAAFVELLCLSSRLGWFGVCFWCPFQAAQCKFCPHVHPWALRTQTLHPQHQCYQCLCKAGDDPLLALGNQRPQPRAPSPQQIDGAWHGGAEPLPAEKGDPARGVIAWLLWQHRLIPSPRQLPPQPDV